MGLGSCKLEWSFAGLFSLMKISLKVPEIQMIYKRQHIQGPQCPPDSFFTSEKSFFSLQPNFQQTLLYTAELGNYSQECG